MLLTGTHGILSNRHEANFVCIKRGEQLGDCCPSWMLIAKISTKYWIIAYYKIIECSPKLHGGARFYRSEEYTHTHTLNVSSFQTTKSLHYYDQLFQVCLWDFFPVFCIFDKILQKSCYSSISLMWTQTFLQGVWATVSSYWRALSPMWV